MDKEYGLKYNVIGLGVRNVNGSDNSHTLKKRAGKAFHSDIVQSATVYNKAGQVALHLRKVGGGVYVREYNPDV